jgi:cytochrome c biogenesis protein CcmG/thiol:disulfide interchange protein DsbE
MPDPDFESDFESDLEPKKFRLGWVLTLLPFGVLLVLLYAGLQNGDPSRLPSVLQNKPLPDFTLAALPDHKADGVPGLSPADFRTGQPVLLNIWASWCAPCREEHPLLMQLQQDGIAVYGLNYKDDPKAARRFLGQFGNPYDRIGVDPTGRAAIDLGVYGVPETFVVNGRGEIIYRHVGPLEMSAFNDKIRPLLAAPASGAQ